MDSDQVEKILRDFARSRIDVVRRVQRILNDRAYARGGGVKRGRAAG